MLFYFVNYSVPKDTSLQLLLTQIGCLYGCAGLQQGKAILKINFSLFLSDNVIFLSDGSSKEKA